MVANRARAMWSMRLHSAIRTALACTIVGCVTLYSPPSLAKQLAFPSFSYVTSTFIVSDATLGHALRGCWHAFFATLQVMPLSMLGLWLHDYVSDDHFSPEVAALMVAVSAFLVALPESTDLMCKRIAFGQIVIVYVDAVIHGVYVNSPVMHPLRIAFSTALGAMASILALLLPYPWLAYGEVTKLYQIYAESASGRINLYLKALHTQDDQITMDLISQTKPFTDTGTKILETIKLLEEGLQWEKPWLRYLNPYFKDPAHGFQNMDISMKGMEVALTSCPSFSTRMIDKELFKVSHHVMMFLGEKMGQDRSSLPHHSATEMEFEKDSSRQQSEPILPTKQDQPALFFLSCFRMCTSDSDMITPITEGLRGTTGSSNKSCCRRVCIDWTMPMINERMVVFAFKCSFSLGLAVLLGLLFNTENGYWSGLTIALSFVTGKQAIFTEANARAQGTAIGSVYGVLGCTIFQKVAQIRFLSLLPWIIFTTFLRHSRMFTQAGGTAALIGSLLILGRKSYGPPSEFAMYRLTEAFIGLACYVVVELILQPTSSATLVKKHLYLIQRTLKDCTKHMVVDSREKGLMEKQRNMKSQVHDLEKFIKDAVLEPSLWFSPFPISCYQKLQQSLSKMADVLFFMGYEIEFLSQAFDRYYPDKRELQQYINKDLQHFKDALSSSVSCFEKTISIRLLKTSQIQPEQNILYDLEEGNSSRPNACIVSSRNDEEMEMEMILSSFLQNSNEVHGKVRDIAGIELRGTIVGCLCALKFCMSFLEREVRDIDIGIKDLVRWEDPLGEPTRS
ncbi:hypothetical protein K7X08_014328 [Anisodus acutangulus]|uniref:Integral membrane bound transporter domain-containing protein n=1 Tax=Anisodus acutangulus TaxID=402998 RepID=A0A9Q1R2A5_9SOLA|nr:hypothetical protein K7X08_014328 [Anisodus acutangulus]